MIGKFLVVYKIEGSAPSLVMQKKGGGGGYDGEIKIYPIPRDQGYFLLFVLMNRHTNLYLTSDQQLKRTNLSLT